MKKRAAPSLFHSSLPCTPSLAAKKSVPPIAARCPGCSSRWRGFTCSSWCRRTGSALSPSGAPTEAEARRCRPPRSERRRPPRPKGLAGRTRPCASGPHAGHEGIHGVHGEQVALASILAPTRRGGRPPRPPPCRVRTRPAFRTPDPDGGLNAVPEEGISFVQGPRRKTSQGRSIPQAVWTEAHRETCRKASGQALQVPDARGSRARRARSIAAHGRRQLPGLLPSHGRPSSAPAAPPGEAEAAARERRAWW